MTGIAAGKPWSRIGPEVAPTSDAASGVWGSLNEVSGYVGAGTWPVPYEPGYNFFGTVAASSGRLLTFTNIPQDAQDLIILLYTRTAGSSTTVSFIPNATTIGATAAPGGFSFTNNGFNDGRKTNATTYASAIYTNGWNAAVTVYNYSSTTAAKDLFYHGGQASGLNTSTFTEWGFANYATLGSTAVTSFSILHNSQDMTGDSFASVFGIGAKI